MFRTGRLLLLLGVTLVGTAPHRTAVADEPFDDAAISCAEDAFGDPPANGSGIEHFQAASEWGKYLAGAVDAAEVQLAHRISITTDRQEREALRAKLRLVRTVGTAAALAFGARGYLTSPDPYTWPDPRISKGVRSLLVITTDLRFLSLVSFRTIWQQSIRGAEARRDALAGLIDEALRDLDDEPGADVTKQGKKAVKLAALAVTVMAEMQAVRDAMEIPLSAVPEFGTPEDRDARRARKQFKGLGNDYGSLLTLLSRIAKQIRTKVDDAIAKARKGAPCDLTDPQNPFIGGGWVEASIDDGPTETWRGQTNASQVGTNRAVVWFGSLQTDRPAILFELYGRKTTKPGVYDVLDRPTSDDAYRRDYAVGSLKLDEGPYGTNVYWLVAGKLRIDTLKTGGKRNITGSFDVWGEDPDDERLRHVVGTFDLCGFQVERPDGSID